VASPFRPLFTLLTGFVGLRLLLPLMGLRVGGAGVSHIGASLFVIPIEESLGIGRGFVSSIFAASLLVGNITAPLSGILIDRIGARKMLMVTVLLTVTGYILLSQADGVILVILAVAGFVGLGSMTLAFMVPSVIVNNWFSKYKATAMSSLQAGTGLGGLIIVPILSLTIATLGWREASFVAAFLVLILAMPAIILIRNTPEELGLQPDGLPLKAVTGQQSTQTTSNEGLSAIQAMRTRLFWMVTTAIVLYGALMYTVLLHFVPLLVWKGMDQVEAAILVSFWGGVSIPGVVIAGILADRFHRLKIAAILVLLAGIGLLILNIGNATWMYWIAVIFMAGMLGTFPLAWAATGEAVGRRSFGTIRGVMTALMIFTTTPMPAIAGNIFDRTGTYTMAIWIIIAAAAVSAVLLMLAPHTRQNTQRL
jgi:sugar phosphate permease